MIVTTSARRTSPAYPTITDTGSYPPPSSGTYAYNADVRPALGASYRDPVFGKLIRRLSDDGVAAGDQNYSFHYVNCDGTLCFHQVSGGNLYIINTSDGSSAYTGVPVGVNSAEVRWSMTDPDKYYYWSGSSLMRRNLAAGTDTTIKTFPATLQVMGGSENYQDKTDRYFIVKYSDSVKLWDSQTDTIYTNTVTTLDASGWATITPSGNYIVTAAGSTAQPQEEHYAYAVNHTTKTISTTPIQFWGMGGDHGCTISASDGKDYAIFFEAYDVAAVYRCDVSVDVAGLTASQQRAAQLQIADIEFGDAGHFSAVSTGAYQDWVFISTYTVASDGFDSAVGTWRPFKAEVFAVNVVTGAYKRLCHHRSRGDHSTYYTSPRASCSANGNFVVFASNMNDSTPTGYADLYGIANPLS